MLRDKVPESRFGWSWLLAPAIVRDEFSLGTVQCPRLARSIWTLQCLLVRADAC